MSRLLLIAFVVFTSAMNACLQPNTKATTSQPSTSNASFFTDEKGDTIHFVTKSEEEWKKSLAPAAYTVLREQGTEFAFTGKYHNQHDEGLYTCAACGLTLFSSDTKFDSGTGWPSFYAPIDKTHVSDVVDRTHGMSRTEVVCHRCGGHLGHVFDDGPKPTGLRYCMNSISLDFVKK